MPLERGSPIGYNAKLLVFEFSMMNGSHAIFCQISITAMDGLEKRRTYGVPDRLTQFLQFRDIIEMVASDLWDGQGLDPDGKLRIYRKHFRSG